jgi:hypothetical protein
MDSSSNDACATSGLLTCNIFGVVISRGKEGRDFGAAS